MFEIEVILRDKHGNIFAGVETKLSKKDFQEIPSDDLCRRYMVPAVESLKLQSGC